MKEMTPGCQFSIVGYDVVASADYAEGGGPFGQVLLLSNNSSHFLLCVRQGDADDMAQLEKSYRYDDVAEAGEVEETYRKALVDMCAIACTR